MNDPDDPYEGLYAVLSVLRLVIGLILACGILYLLWRS